MRKYRFTSQIELDFATQKIFLYSFPYLKRAKDELIYFLFNQLFCRDNLLVALKKKEVEWEVNLNVKINLPI